MFRGGIQCDAHEALVFLLNAINEEIGDEYDEVWEGVVTAALARESEEREEMREMAEKMNEMWDQNEESSGINRDEMDRKQSCDSSKVNEKVQFETNLTNSPLHQPKPLEASSSQLVRLSSSVLQHLSSSPTNIITRVFMGTLHCTIRCFNCQHVSATTQQFICLSVPIPTREDVKRLNERSISTSYSPSTSSRSLMERFSSFFSSLSHTVTLTECLSTFCLPEIIGETNKYKCDNCKQLSDVEKITLVSQCPEYLVIQVKRFKFVGQAPYKIEDNVLFDKYLDLSPFLKSYQPSHQEQALPYMYSLSSVIVHKGMASRGHYLCYMFHPMLNVWFECNDSELTKVDEKVVLSQQAYILFYKRCEMKSNSFAAQLLTPKEELGKACIAENEIHEMGKEMGRGDKKDRVRDRNDSEWLHIQSKRQRMKEKLIVETIRRKMDNADYSAFPGQNDDSFSFSSEFSSSSLPQSTAIQPRQSRKIGIKPFLDTLDPLSPELDIDRLAGIDLNRPREFLLPLERLISFTTLSNPLDDTLTSILLCSHNKLHFCFPTISVSPFVWKEITKLFRNHQSLSVKSSTQECEICSARNETN